MLNPIRIGEVGLKRLLRAFWRMKGPIFGVLVPALLFLFVVGFYVTPCGGDSNKEEAKIQIGNLKQSLDMYYTRTDPHRYPMYLDLLVHRNIMKEIPRDPWGEPYVYDLDSRTEYTLYSKGPDRKVGTEDDVHPGM